MSNNTIKFEIVTPEEVVFKKEITQITLPTKQGEITVLPDHIPLVASLKPGVVEIVEKDLSREVLFVSGGFIEVLKNKIIILADIAERAEEIDLKKAEEARQQAEKTVKGIRHFDAERFTAINSQIARELAKAKAVKRWKKIKNIN